MNPTEEQLKNREIAASGGTLPEVEQSGYASMPITSASLAPTSITEFKQPQDVPVFDVRSLAPEILTTESEDQAQGESDQLQQLNKMLVGESAFRSEQEKAQGLPQLQKSQKQLSARLQGLVNQSLAIPLQIQQDAQGRGVTVGGVAPLEMAKKRELAIEALTVNSLLAASQGNLAVAQDNVDRAVKQKFDPIKEEIKARTDNYNLIINSPAFSVQEKNRAAQLQYFNDARTRQIAKEENNQKEVYNHALTALKYGADMETVAKMQKAKTPQEALAIGGKFLLDPKAKFEVENARLDTLLKGAQIDRENAAAAKLRRETGEIGKPTKEEKEAQEKAKATIPALKDKIDNITNLLVSPGLRGSVGVYGIGRFTPFSIDKAQRANFVASVSQLTSQETLDKLTDLKAKGGTLGALNVEELNMLNGAATKLNTWAIRDDSGKVTGYQIDEESFKDELRQIQALAERAYARASGELLTPDEKAAMEVFYNEGALQSNFNAATYFNQ